MWVAVTIAILAAFAAAYFLAPRKPKVRSEFKPYGQIRQDLIDELADADSTVHPAPVRPPNLDMRLPAAKADEIARLFPPS